MTKRETNFGAVEIVSQISPDMLGSILAHASDVVISLDADLKIRTLFQNPFTDPLGSLDHWTGKNVNEFLCDISVTKLARQIDDLKSSDRSVSRQIEVNHVDPDAGEFPVLYTVHKTGRNDMLLMLGRDLRPVAEAQQKLVQAQVALERDYEKYRVSETRYNAAMEATRDALVFVDAQTGRVVDANAAANRLLTGTEAKLSGSDFAAHFQDRRHPEFLEALHRAATRQTDKPVAASTTRGRKKVRIRSGLFRAAGNALLLCQIEPKEGSSAAGDSIADALGAIYENSPDAIVFTDSRGVIQHANNGFLALCDLGELNTVKGQSLADYLTRGNVDLKVLLENASHAGKLRVYATKLETAFGSTIPVELSATSLVDQPGSTFGFIIRDSSRSDAARDLGFTLSSDAERNIMELVGSTSLKDIVSATTDVVERMCIEAAVNLTRNNRVAAAEMLGLSRQSLYVKLRKYGLLNRDDAN